MFLFFRQIRQGMVEKDQFYKYLKYAIGEIILVVLGIQGSIIVLINQIEDELKILKSN